MSRLSNLRAKPTIITLSDGQEFSVYPLTMSDEAEFAQLQLDEKRAASMLFLLQQTIKYSVPDATTEEMNLLNNKDKASILKTALEINGLKLSGGEDPKQ